MNERLKILRKEHLNLSQAEFAKKINYSRSGLASIEQGSRSLTERTIADICRVFDVNENWLRYGTGEIFVDNNYSQFKDSFIYALGRMTPEQWQSLYKFANDMHDFNIKKEGSK